MPKTLDGYITRTEDCTDIDPIIEEDIIGFIKFSDYIKDDGEKENHFQQLV